MIATFQTANQRMSEFESQVAAAEKAGERVDYTVKPIYGDSFLYPQSIQIVAKGDLGFTLDVNIPNVE